MSALAGDPVPVHSLAVRKMPKSGKPDELLEYEEISRNAIVRKVKEVAKGR
jgi:transketolase